MVAHYRPLKVHVLVVTVDQRPKAEEAPLDSVQIANHRMRGGEFDWYFIDVFYASDSSFQSFHLISHQLVKFLNRHNSSPEWDIQLELCRHYEIIRNPPAFDLYQRDLEVCLEMTKHEVVLKSMQARMYLFKWMSCSPDFKKRHPLSEYHVQYAGINNTYNPYDTIAFHYLAHALRRVPEAKQRWMRGEVRLLKYKLMQRPDLFQEICEITQASPKSFKRACTVLDQVIERNYSRIVQSDASFFNPKSKLAQYATAFHRVLVQADRHEREDTRARELKEAERANPHLRHIPLKLNDSEPVHIIDIEDCAPMCIKHDLSVAMGTVQQQAEMTHFHRRHVAHHLMELGHEPEKVTQLMRPKRVEEYGLESPQMSMEEIQQAVAQTHEDRMINLHEHNSHFRSCTTIMRGGLCPHQPPVSAQRHRFSKEEKEAENHRRYHTAKEECHTHLVNLWDRRKADRVSDGKVVKKEWTNSPYSFTKVALQGADANVDAKEARTEATEQM